MRCDILQGDQQLTCRLDWVAGEKWNPQHSLKEGQLRKDVTERWWAEEGKDTFQEECWAGGCKEVIIGDLLLQPCIEEYTRNRSVMNFRMFCAPLQICCSRDLLRSQCLEQGKLNYTLIIDCTNLPSLCDLQSITPVICRVVILLND